MTRGLIVAGFAALSAVALAGWTRTAHVTPSYFNQPMNACEPEPGMPANYNGFTATAPGPYGAPVTPYGTPVMYAPAPQYASYSQPYAQNMGPVTSPAPRRVVRREYVSQPVVTARRGRPFSHSAAIVAGSAAGGAALGALAGGGRGAAIGALAGGGAGFLYDRLTHNR